MQRKNSASPRPLRFMTSDREPLLLEPQHALMKALPSNARLKLMSNPQNAFQSNYPVASPRKMANLQWTRFPAGPVGRKADSCRALQPNSISLIACNVLTGQRVEPARPYFAAAG